jgi:hypothetical protein
VRHQCANSINDNTLGQPNPVAITSIQARACLVSKRFRRIPLLMIFCVVWFIYSFRPLLLILNIDVSRHILVSKYIIILETSNSGWREYKI